MAEHDRPPVGSVAEEASRLLDALGGWAGTAGAAYAAWAPHAHAPATENPENPADPAAVHDPGGEEAPGADGPEVHGAGHCQSCGAENGVGQAVTCQLCPVCQGIALLRSVRPETVDRLADLAGALAATLRDLADQRRPGPPGSDPRPGSSHGGGAAGPRVQDIRVDSDDEETGEAP